MNDNRTRWIYSPERGQYIFQDISIGYDPAVGVEPEKHDKIIIPEEQIGELVVLLERTGRVHEKERSDDLKIIHRLIDIIEGDDKK